MPNANSGGVDEGSDDASSLDAGRVAECSDEDSSLAERRAAGSEGARDGPSRSGGPTGSRRGTPLPNVATGLPLPTRSTPQPAPSSGRPGILGVDDEAEGDDELLRAVRDVDYSAQLSWQ